MTARFKYVEKAYDIAFDIGIRIGDAVPDSGLSRQIDNDTYSVTLKNGVNYVLVRYGSLYERPFASGLPGALFYFGEPAIFDIDIIIVSNRVYPDYRNAAPVTRTVLPEKFTLGASMIKALLPEHASHLPWRLDHRTPAPKSSCRCR